MIVVTVVLAVTVAICGAAVFAAKELKEARDARAFPEPRGDFLPKDVPQTPAASPLASPPAEAGLTSGAVTVDLKAGGELGPDTTVSGTATSSDGYVYYRISDYRRGQIAAGQTIVAAGEHRQYRFRPNFDRVYTAGDPAALDVYVLKPDGTEQTTRVEVRLR